MIFTVAACNQNNELKSTIPASASAVVSLNIPAITQQFELSGKQSDSQLGMFTDILLHAGVDNEKKSYVYVPEKGFKSVWLFKIADENALREYIKGKWGCEMEKDSQCEYLIRGEQVYAYHNTMLLIGLLNLGSDETAVLNNARLGLTAQEENICDIESASDILEDDNHCAGAFINMQRASALVNSSKSFKDLVKSYPPLQLFIDNDLKAITATIDIKDDKAMITTAAVADENSQFMKLLSDITNAPGSEFLSVVPNTMTSILAMSVNGEQLASLKPIEDMENVVRQMPFMGKFDLRKLIAAINGPLTISAQEDQTFDDEYNYIITAKSDNPRIITEAIKSFYASWGQAPDVYNGEEIYAYGNKKITVGVTSDKVAYIKMLNYDSTDSALGEDKDLCALFESAPFVVSVYNEDVSFQYTLDKEANGNGVVEPASAFMNLLIF